MNESKIKQQLLKENPLCKECDSNRNLTLFHIISKGQDVRYKLLKNNCCLMCLKCHNIWEHKPWLEKMKKLPNSFCFLMDKIKEIDYKYFCKIWYLKLPEKVKSFLIFNNIKPNE